MVMTTSCEIINIACASPKLRCLYTNIKGAMFSETGIYQSVHLLVQPFKSVRLDSFYFIPVEEEYLQRVESFEGFIVDRGDFVVVQVQDHQAVKVADRFGRNRMQAVLRQIQLRQFVA